MQVKEHLHLAAHDGRAHGLIKEIHRARLVALVGQLRLLVHRRKKHDGQAAGGVGLVDGLRHGKAVHVGQAHIENNKEYAGVAGLGNGLFPVRGLQDPVMV